MPSYCFCEGKQDCVYRAVCPSACVNMSQTHFPDNNGPHYPQSWREGMSSPIRAESTKSAYLIVLVPSFAANESSGAQIICWATKNVLFGALYVVFLISVVCSFIACFLVVRSVKSIIQCCALHSFVVLSSWMQWLIWRCHLCNAVVNPKNLRVGFQCHLVF